MLHEEFRLNTKVEELIGVESWFLFSTMNIKSSWLALPVVEWATNEDFQIARSLVHTVKVVNDTADKDGQVFNE